LQLPDAEFNSVVCFTMLHHVPTPSLQDRMFAEAFRVLQPGGTFAGSDGVPSLFFRVMHLHDTYNPVDPVTLPDRLRRTGYRRARRCQGRPAALAGRQTKANTTRLDQLTLQNSISEPPS
jgi:SAM-dependent methyltransferase